MGLETRLRDLYWWAFLTLSPKQTASVGDTTTRFRVHSRAEYWRTDDFVDERPVLADLLAELSPDDVFYDVGANIGLYSCFAASRLCKGRVVAFEPHPETAERLRTNIALNIEVYDVFEFALADSEDTMVLGPPENGGRPGTFRLRENGGKAAISVDVVRGDELRARAGIPAPSVVKIDVEGAELDVLEGLSKTLSAERCRLVYVEVHPAVLEARGNSQQDVESRLRELGFDISTVHSRDTEAFLKAER
jgi:FkbM family methyltransferase